ncbi:MAG: multidrug effflux MFS transporter [Hyphomonadaceae bacterium]|nr:multidrug effflux MFS transporter [Hyphomonadaceae bacterium]
MPRPIFPTPTNTLSTFELVVMCAALTALNALSIDIMLPALPNIGADFSVAHENDRQLVILSYVATFGVGQLFYGPLTDALGRRPVLVWALGLFVVGTLLCVVASNFTLFLLARALQGLGAAATRVIATAVVRDLTDGRRMAQIMSMSMSVFMVVPVIAPSLGQLILFVGPWRWVFAALLIYAVLILLWAALRLPETLAPENREKLRPMAALSLYARVINNRQTFGYTVAATFGVACLFGYVVSSQQIFVEVFDMGATFPIAFAGLAMALSLGSFINSRIVMRFGMRRIAHWTCVWITGIAALHAALVFFGAHSLWLFLALFGVTFGAFAMVGSNFNALAIQPASHGAGSASAMFGAVTTFGGSVLGGFIGRLYDGTVLPFLGSIALLGLAMLAAAYWTERGKLFREGSG